MTPTQAFRDSHWIPPRHEMAAGVVAWQREYVRLHPDDHDAARERAADYRRAARHALSSGLRDHARYLILSARAAVLVSFPGAA